MINGLGRDETAAALCIGSNGPKRALGYQVDPSVKQKPQLLKRVKLGGGSISESWLKVLTALVQKRPSPSIFSVS